jgi:hypothetical protein
MGDMSSYFSGDTSGMHSEMMWMYKYSDGGGYTYKEKKKREKDFIEESEFKV